MNNTISLSEKRQKGKFWTKLNASNKAFSIINQYIQPDCVIEPFAGGGSLIIPFLNQQCIIFVNDIDAEAIQILKNKFSDNNRILIYTENILNTHLDNLITKWSLNSIQSSILFYSNPPFGTSCTNKLTSKKNEIEESKQSRSIPIQYDADGAEDKWFGDTYGRGDLCIPAIAHMIEMIKRRGDGHLAFFSPFGVLLGRKRYKKLLHALLLDFEFLHGELFSGKDFENVASKIPIVFSLWKYSPNCQTQHESLQFTYENQILHLKKLPLLKDGWKYNNDQIIGKIGVSRNDTFNNPVPKMIKSNLHNAGSFIHPDNVKKELKIPDIPSELAYALWSIIVGYTSITELPIYMNDAYTHLPDFTKSETMEILAYAILYVYYTESKLHLCNNQIGFTSKGNLCFGDDKYTLAIENMLTLYSDLSIGSDKNIQMIIDQLKQNIIDKSVRSIIKYEIDRRLNIIEYWKYIPI